MCGRYVLFTDEDEDDITDLVREIQERLYGDKTVDEGAYNVLAGGEVFPSQLAPVITSSGPRAITWGLPGFNGKGVIINARSETVYEKPLFRSSMVSRRLVVLSHGFYEWKKAPGGKGKEKLLFNLPDTKAMYMAGLYNEYKDGSRFVILTAEANEPMKPIHNRMPVILMPSEVSDYINDNDFARELIQRVPPWVNYKAS